MCLFVRYNCSDLIRESLIGITVDVERALFVGEEEDDVGGSTAGGRKPKEMGLNIAYPASYAA